MEIKQSSKYLVVGVQIFICGDISARMDIVDEEKNW